MMTISIFLLIATLLLLLTLFTGLIRALRGPSIEDRMLSIQLLGTGGVGLIALMSVLLDLSVLIDVAIVLALLAAVSAAALTRRVDENG